MINTFKLIPSLLSLFRIVLTPCIIFLLLSERYTFMACILFIIGASTDYFDGLIARTYKLTTKTGAYLDPLADKIFVLGTLGAFWVKGLIAWWIVGGIALRDIIITLLRNYALSHNLSFTTSWHGKYKTMLQLLLIGLLFALTLKLVSPLYQEVISLLVYSVFATTILSGIFYVYTNRALFMKK